MWQIRLFTDFTDFSTFWSNFRAFCSPNQNILKSDLKIPKFVQFVTNLTNFVANLVTLSHLGPIWPTLEPNLPSLTLSHIQTCVLYVTTSRVYYVTHSYVCATSLECWRHSDNYPALSSAWTARYARCLLYHMVIIRRFPLCGVPTMQAVSLNTI